MELSSVTIAGTRLVATLGDLTTMNVDVVVNAANEHLVHGGGLAAALAEAGGPAVEEESNRWVAEHGPVTPGTAAVTTAGTMPAGHIAHVVGPRYSGRPEDPDHLAGAVAAALDAAASVEAATVALPAISAGIFGYPAPEACTVITETAAGWLTRNPAVFTAVRLVAHERAVADLFATAVAALH